MQSQTNTKPFIGRPKELTDLNELIFEPDAQFLILYGRRRVGKTRLLVHWAQQSGHPYIYWVANRMSPAMQLRSFSQTVYQSLHPNTSIDTHFTYPTWEMAIQQATLLAQQQRLILIIDEFPYLSEAEPGIASLVQNLWDHMLNMTQIVFVLAGSHIGMMSTLMEYNAPLYGRFTAHLHLKALPFQTTSQFLPAYTTAERVAVYAILGGIPAYLERFRDDQNLKQNVYRTIFKSTGVFRVDPLFLLQDQVREPRNYLSVLNAIGAGNHTLTEIAKVAGLPKQNVSSYLDRLGTLYLVERRVPVTTPQDKRDGSRRGRWHLRDAYLRFYFRFIAPNQRALELELYDAVWEAIHEQLRAFIGMTTFEELCREWMAAQAKQNKLPFIPEDIGSHWSAKVQIDAMAISWRHHKILVGECKWGVKRVGADVIRDLVMNKGVQVLVDLGDTKQNPWQVYLICFARAGFTEVAHKLAEEHDVQLVNLLGIEAGLR